MAARQEKKKLALDSNFLMDLAGERDFAHTFREVFQEKGYVLLVPPTAIQEITFATTRKSGEKQALAHRALLKMREWGLRPFDLIPVGHGITQQFTRRLRERGLLAEEESPRWRHPRRGFACGHPRSRHLGSSSAGHG